MKRFVYLLLFILLLIGVLTAYQYVQYQKHLTALKAHNKEVLEAMPVDSISNGHPPAASYYKHHQQLSSIANFNPLLRAGITKSLYFYDFDKYNSAVIDFYGLLNYRDRTLAQADSSAQDSIKQQVKAYRAQLCSRWSDFAKHLYKSYPNQSVATKLNNLCASDIISYQQNTLLESAIDPTKM